MGLFKKIEKKVASKDISRLNINLLLKNKKFENYFLVETAFEGYWTINDENGNLLYSVESAAFTSIIRGAFSYKVIYDSNNSDICEVYKEILDYGTHQEIQIILVPWKDKYVVSDYVFNGDSFTIKKVTKTEKKGFLSRTKEIFETYTVTGYEKARELKYDVFKENNKVGRIISSTNETIKDMYLIDFMNPDDAELMVVIFTAILSKCH